MTTHHKIGGIYLVTVVVVLLQGCSTADFKLVTREQVAGEPLQNVRVVHQNTVQPVLKTPMGVVVSKLTFGMSEALSTGQNLARKFKIKDPGQMVKERFLMQVNRGAKIANFYNDRQPVTYYDSSVEMMKKRYKSGLILKINAHWWEIWYYPDDFSHYQMWFQASAELVRLDDAKVLWKGDCRADQKDKKSSPTLDELIADNSKVLQRWVDDATNQCADQLVQNFPERF